MSTVPTLRESHTPLRFALALLLIASACGRSSLDSSYAAAQDAVRRGALDEALSHVDRATTMTGSDLDNPSVHQLRLLRAEIFLAKPDIPAAAALVNSPIPDGYEFASSRARQRYVRARLEIARGQLKQALATLDSMEELNPEPDLRLDVEVLARCCYDSVAWRKARHD